jgi:ATP-binding cassette, subfamily C (CFTR/MRP), member 1
MSELASCLPDAMAMLLTLCYSFVYVFIVTRTSRNLHAIILRAVMRAPMSFLSNTETGLLMNRFSQDLRLVDLILPRSFLVAGFRELR